MGAFSLRRAARSLLQSVESPRAAGVRLAKEIDWSSAQPGRDTVLCLDRSQFIKDIKELRSYTDLNWVTLNATRLKARQEAWVQPPDREQGYLSTWLREERCGAIRPILATFGTALLEAANRRTRIDAVATANIDYWQDETIKLACNALNIPFLVLCRENYTIPWTVPWMHDHLRKARFVFQGAGLAVFSQATKDAFAPGFDDSDDIWVTGAPRYDRWMNLELLPDSAKDHISLITFNDPGYMAEAAFGEVAAVFDQVASETTHDGLVWLVKCKKKGDRDEILERLNTTDASPRGSRLRFEYETPLFDLYPRSRIVIGYNSLALVEAMLTDAPVVVPCWGETRAPRKDLLIDYDDPLAQGVMTFAQSPDELADLLRRAATGEKLKTGTPEARRALFATHLHTPPQGTTASQAVERFVHYYIDRARARTKSVS